ncbi:unnamed protein product [Mytilus coruscus]|uniref:Novel STAND NTPase 3 domain-containing protein n=1 Tax=Mytilus coruscus TaxID=42192 RepID=A0A6J8CIN8_MYTCO|nr:unnamed protein product [Mytilus coruscus]
MTLMSQLKEEERNFVRFVFLNFKVSPDITRRFFDGVFPPNFLNQTINSSVCNIIKLHKGKQISSIQLNLLRGVPGTKWTPYYHPMPVGTQEKNAAFVETWLKDDENFNETKGSTLVYDKIKQCSCILEKSNSGLGKTVTIRHIAFKFKQEGFDIVSIESPEDIIKYKTNKKQVFLIDDVLGKYDLSPILLEQWIRINEKLISCLDK